MTHRSLSLQLSSAALITTLVLGTPRPARAENDLQYDYENYREAGGRITVQANGVQLDQDLTPALHFRLGGVLDTITGATPTGESASGGSNQVPLARLTDRRKAWNTELSDQLGRFNLAGGFSRSLEHDYTSNGWSLNSSADFNQKNTTLRFGTAGTENNVETFSGWHLKRTNDFILGVSQILDPETWVSWDVTWSRATGYLNEPYKVVLANVQVFPGVFLPETFAENRPHEHNKGIGTATVDHAFARLNGSVEASYRFTRDTWGITTDTIELAWYQHLGPKLIIRPMLRYYDQTAASFYHYRLGGIAPTRFPNPHGVLYSSDARLSNFRSYSSGLKAIWTVNDTLQFDVGIEAYGQEGRDGVTPQTAYYRATMTRGGLKFSW